jgi:hypothetical protein
LYFTLIGISIVLIVIGALLQMTDWDGAGQIMIITAIGISVALAIIIPALHIWG